MHELKPEFLKMLVEAARHYGWYGDHIEVRQFVQWCYETAGLPIPTREQLEPYKD